MELTIILMFAGFIVGVVTSTYFFCKGLKTGVKITRQIIRDEPIDFIGEGKNQITQEYVGEGEGEES